MTNRCCACTAALALLVGVTWLPLFVQVHAQEARYKGRTFSEWQNDLQDLAVDVRKVALQAIPHFGPQAAPAVVKALKDSDADIRLLAVHALHEIGPAAKEVLPALTKVLRDSDKRLQSSAVYVLGRIGPAAKEALPALFALRDSNKDKDRERNIEEAIQKIEGR